MKRRCFPLRGNHSLRPHDTHTPSGAELCEQVRLEGVASPLGHLRDSSICETAVGSTRRRLSASPTRRLRFEDETEMEAESRYLERQRRRTGRLGKGLLTSKPDLNVIISGTADHVYRPQRPHTVVLVGSTCGTVGGITFHPRPPLPLNDDEVQTLTRHRLNLRTEPIKETYIGLVSPRKAQMESGSGGSVSHMHVRRKADHVVSNKTVGTVGQTFPPNDLPINPYDTACMATPTQDNVTDRPTFRCPSPSDPLLVTSVMMSQIEKLNGSKAGNSMAKKAENLGRRAAVQPPTELQVGSMLEVKAHPPGGACSDTTVESQAPPTTGSVDDQITQPQGALLAGDQPLTSAHFCSRDEPSRLSLRHLFSAVRLGRNRTGSLSRLSSKTFSNSASSGTSKSFGLLKKSASVQSLYVGAPLLGLKQSLSSQSFQSEQKKRDPSVDYSPAVEQPVSRCLSVDDVGLPCAVRPVGRLLQVCNDGTLLLELNRPTDQAFGFIIGRGRRRCDSGVYVEDMVDHRTQKLYAGLLSVGDEILEVNEEKVAHLSLDQVTRLLIQNLCTTIRVLRRHRLFPGGHSNESP